MQFLWETDKIFLEDTSNTLLKPHKKEFLIRPILGIKIDFDRKSSSKFEQNLPRQSQYRGIFCNFGGKQTKKYFSDTLSLMLRAYKNYFSWYSLFCSVALHDCKKCLILYQNIQQKITKNLTYVTFWWKTDKVLCFCIEKLIFFVVQVFLNVNRYFLSKILRFNFSKDFWDSQSLIPT